MVKVKILKALPQFIGSDANTIYGPYEPGDVADVDAVTADILIFRKLAEKIEGVSE